MAGKIRTGIALGLAFAGGMCAAMYGVAAIRYVSSAVSGGDWLNDWITHLPRWIVQVALFCHGIG